MVLKTLILLFLLWEYRPIRGQSEIPSLVSCEHWYSCSGHGACNNATNQCICDRGYAGSDCSTCAVGYFNFPDCVSCSQYCEPNNGTCVKNENTCSCGDPTRFRGVYCTKCQPHHYGINCVANLKLFYIDP
jgi:laminin, alpha 3/5